MHVQVPRCEMGVPGLLKTCKTQSTHIEYAYLSGKTIAIDLFVYLMQIVKSGNNPTRRFHGRVLDNLLSGVLNVAASLMEAGVEVVVVADGTPVPAKSNGTGLARRARVRDAIGALAGSTFVFSVTICGLYPLTSQLPLPPHIAAAPLLRCFCFRATYICVMIGAV